MCEYFSEKSVPFITISNSNQEAKTLYEQRCTYVVQQEYLAGQEFALMLEVRACGMACFFCWRTSTWYVQLVSICMHVEGWVLRVLGFYDFSWWSHRW